jgi:hypothetical protein
MRERESVEMKNEKCVSEKEKLEMSVVKGRS